VLHLEGPELHEARRQLRAGSERAREIQEILDECEAILVASRACRLEAYKAGVLPHRIEVVPPGVDLERFRPGSKPEALLHRVEAGRGGPVLLVVAGRGPARDPATLYRALGAILAQKGGAVLAVVGPVGAEWKALAEEHRVANAVRFVGTVAEAELPEWYRAADLFIMAHREDRSEGRIPGVEVALVEAIASGLPVVATHAPGIEEIVPNDECGLLVEPEAHAKLARSVLDLLRTPEQMNEFRKAARERALREFPADAAAARFREFLEVIWFRRLGRGRPAPEELAANRSAA
jgi:glycosyltransferase involved in cell wall biosynthesis